MKKMYIVIIAVLLIASSAFAKKVEVEITDITFVKASSEATPSKILLKFELPVELTEAKIDLAKLIIQIPPNESLGQSFPIAIFPYHDNWTASLIPITLNDLNYSDSLAYVTFIRPVFDNETVSQHFDITQMVRDWHNEEYTNNGLIIMPASEINTPLPMSDMTGNTLPEARVIIYYIGPEIEMDSSFVH